MMLKKTTRLVLMGIMFIASVSYGGTRLLYTFDKYDSKDAKHDLFIDISGNGHDGITNVPLNKRGYYFDLKSDNPFIKEYKKNDNNKSVRTLAQWRTITPENIKSIYDGKTNQWTLEAWIKSASANAPTNYFCLLGFGGNLQKNDYTQSIKLGFIANKTKNRTSPALEFNDGAKTYTIVDHNVFCWAEQWIHVAATYDGKNVKLYVNGKKIGEAVSGEKMMPLSRVLFLADSKVQFKGNIDDLRISDEALKPAELGYYGPLSSATSDSISTAQWLKKAKDEGVRFIWTNTYPYGDKKWNGNKVKRLEIHMDRLKKHGINTIGVGYELLRDVQSPSDESGKSYFSAFDEQRVAHLRRVIRAAKNAGLAIMIILQTYKEPYVEIIKDKNYRKVVDMYGTTGFRLACPADWSFWEGIELPRMELVARLLSEEKATGGILYETEAYCARKFYPGYGSQKTQFCYCDTCFEKFMKKYGMTGKLPKRTQRYEWLCRKGLDGKYQDYMIDVFAEVYGKVFRHIREINPDTLAGLYQLGVDPNSDGFAKGTATKRLPAMLFSSAEYFYGYDRPEIFGFSNVARSRDFQAHLSKMGLNIWFLGGLITGPYWPKQYAAELNLLLRRTDGYWIYDGSIFLKPAKSVVTSDPKSRSQYRLRDTPAKFWAEIAKANKAKPQRDVKSTKPEQLPLVTDFKLVKSDKNTSPQLLKTKWKCKGVELKQEKGAYIFPADASVSGKRTSSIEAMLKKVDIGVTYGLRVKVENSDSKNSRWINLGYSRKPPYPVFYDTNFLVRPATTKEYKYVFNTKKKWGKNYWVRVGVRNGDIPLKVKPFAVERLYEVEFLSSPVTLPEGEKVCLGMAELNNKIFKLRYDLISVEDGKDLMTVCNGTTDISGLHQLDIHKARIRVKLLTTVPGLFKKCPKLNWNIWSNK